MCSSDEDEDEGEGEGEGEGAAAITDQRLNLGIGVCYSTNVYYMIFILAIPWYSYLYTPTPDIYTLLPRIFIPSHPGY